MATEAAQTKQSAEKKKDEPQIEVKEMNEPEKPKAEGPKADKPKAEKTAAGSPAEPMSRAGRAEAIVRRNMLWGLGAGVIPMPLFDVIAVTGVQVKLLAELSELYGVGFREEAAKKIIGSLLTGVLGVNTGLLIGGSLAKLIPVVGTAFGVVSVPVITGAFTWALGKVFIMHFEAGGTLLDFDPKAMRSYFKQEFEKAKEQVAEAQKKEQQAQAAKPS